MEVSIAGEIRLDWGPEERIDVLAAIRGLFRNLAAMLPWRKDSGVAARNMLRKVMTLSSCCGNHGQPGC